MFALASHFNRALGVIGEVAHLDRDLAGAPDNAFMLVEDIDMLAISREPPAGAPVPTSQADKATTERQLSALHVLINALDGVGTPHGLIMLMTTNYRNDWTRADPRRPDRPRPRNGAARRQAAAAMFAAFYGGEQVPTDYLRDDYRPMTGAELQAIFMAERDAVGAVRRMRDSRAAI